MRNLKRALSLALASVMLLGMMVVGTSAASYPDVDDADNLEAIEVMKAAGIMIGDNGNFNPDQKVTRNEMAVVMANMLGLNAADYAGIELPFTDVPDWAKAFVAACYTNGIVSGTSATTYGGNDTVTAAQAGLMMMKALGYFQFQPDFGDDWMLATVKQASDIELYDGIEAGAKAPLTRNDVAQLALNALESDVMDYSGSQGTDIKTADGTTIKIGYTIKYDVHKTTTYNYNGSTNTNMQLVEKLYKNKLTKSVATDDFQRTAHEWKYENKSVIKAADDAKLTYTKEVNGKTLYSDLGLTATYTGARVWLNGAANTPATINIVKNDKATKLGGNGTKLEVYVTKNASTGVITAIDLVMIQTAYGKIASVGKDADDNRIVRVGSKTYKTEGFAKDDTVLYTWVGTEIKSMVAVEKQTGTITKIVGNDYYIDDVKYSTNATAVVAGTVNDKVDFYVDANGYIVKMEVSSETVNLDNLAYVDKANTDRGNYAILRLADGTKMTVDTDKNYNALEKHIVTFKETKDGYKLTNQSGTKALNALSANYTDDATSLTVATDGTYKLDSKTTFLYKVTDASNNVSYKVYTGYKNAPAFDMAATSQAVAYEKLGVAVFMYVEVKSSDLKDTLDNLVFVAFDSDVKWTDEGDGNAYYAYAAVVDGKVTTLKVDNATGWTKVSANGYGVFANNIPVDSDNIATDLTLSTLTPVIDNKVEYKNGVITVNSTAYAYEDDVAVYVVNSDQEITIATVEDIQKDDESTDNNPYDYVLAVRNAKNKIEAIAVFEK